SLSPARCCRRRSPMRTARAAVLRSASGWWPHSRRMTAWCWSGEAMNSGRLFTGPARLAAVAPCLWLALFFLVPFGIVIKISLSQTVIAQPPYLPVFDLAAGWEAFTASLSQLSIDNYRLLITDDLYLLSYLRSIMVA